MSKALSGFREGDQVKAVIIEIDQGKRRINFSIKPSRFESGDFAKAENGDIEVEDADSEDGDGQDGIDSDEEKMRESEESEADEADGADMASDEDDDESRIALLDDDNDDDDGAESSGAEDEEDSLEGNEEGHEAAGIGAVPHKVNGNIIQKSGISAGGFDWSDADDESDAESSGSSVDEDELAEPSKSKSKGKQKASYDLASATTEGKPESATEFERALLASPNSSYLWIQYMSFLLQLHEVDKARKIGRQALQRIGFREEEEKLNVWMALINAELGFGTLESADKVFKEAAEYNDEQTVYLRYAESLNESGKTEVS